MRLIKRYVSKAFINKLYFRLPILKAHPGDLKSIEHIKKIVINEKITVTYFIKCPIFHAHFSVKAAKPILHKISQFLALYDTLGL